MCMYCGEQVVLAVLATSPCWAALLRNTVFKKAKPTNIKRPPPPPAPPEKRGGSPWESSR